jgi:membrane protein
MAENGKSKLADAHEQPPPQQHPEAGDQRLQVEVLSRAVARSAYSVARAAFSAFRRNNMTSVAAALAYYAFLSVPAGLMVAVGTFGLLAGPNAVNVVVDKLHGIVPAQAATLVDDSLHRLVENKGTGLTVLLVGLLVALWSLTGAMQNVMWGVGIAHGCPDRRGFVKKRLVAVAMIAFALIGFAVSFGVLVLGPALSTWIGRASHQQGLVKTAWYIAEWPLALIGLLVAFAGLLAFAPDRRDSDRRAVSYGVVVATVLWVIASALFSVYLSGFASYNKTWGSLAAVVIMLTWLWLGGVALLFGAEVDAELERRRGFEPRADETAPDDPRREEPSSRPATARHS